MIALSLPEPGHAFGWSVAAGELIKAMKELTPIAVAPTQSDIPMEYGVPVLHAVQGVNLLPLRPHIWSKTKNAGYSFIEDNLLVGKYVPNARRYFDHVVSGSTWGAQILREVGLTDVSVAIQGVNRRFFEVAPKKPDDKFIVFSGGKAELRKGQDIVLKAMKVFMDRHSDVYLSTAWHNPWKTAGYQEIYKLRCEIGLHWKRLLGPGIGQEVEHDAISGIYREADVGLFPNRAEAGNNMVLCEFMATGRPVIAAYSTGQIDALEKDQQLNLTEFTNVLVRNQDGVPTALWPEPSVDETIAKLEWAYQNREALSLLGVACRERMRAFTWARCAKDLLQVLEHSQRPDVDVDSPKDRGLKTHA